MFLPDPSGHRDVALGLCRDAGRVLLVLNARSVQGTATRYWDLPGGSVEPGEGVKEALVREWEEEVGWKPSVGELLFVSDGSKRTSSDAPALYTWRVFVFDVPAPPFGVMPRPGPEIEKVDMVQEAHLAQRMTAPYHAPFLAFFRGGPRYASFSWIEPAAPENAAIEPGLRRLCVLAAAAAYGDAALVLSETQAALLEGVPAARLEETLLQIVPYAGFPRALAAFSAARGALPAAASGAPAGGADGGAGGVGAFEAVYGETAEKVRAGLARLHPLLPEWTIEFAYGRVLSRPALSPKEREVLAVSILTALGSVDDALLGHMRAAIRLGATPEAVAGAVAVVPSSAGEGKRAAARAVLARL